MTKIKFFLLLTILVFAVTAFKCGGKSNGGNPDDGIFRGVAFTNYRATTGKGATLFARNPVNPALLPLADEGLDTLFRIAASKANSYSVGLEHNLYTILLFPRSPLCINPAFLMDASGSPYDQTEYDKDPRPGIVTLCAAGMMAGSNYAMLVVDDVGTMATIVRYEGEHLVLFHNDYPRFEATMYHIGSGHPIMPDISENRTAQEQQSFKELSITLQEPVKFGEKNLPVGTQVCILLTK